MGNLAGFRLGILEHLLNHVTWISVVIIVVEKKRIKNVNIRPDFQV